MSETLSEAVKRHFLTQKKKYFYLSSLIVEGGNDWAELFLLLFELELHFPDFLDAENKFFSCLVQTKAPELVFQYVFSDRECVDLSNKEVISIAHWVVKRHPTPHMDHEKREMYYVTWYSLLAYDLKEKDSQSKFCHFWTRCADAFLRLDIESYPPEKQIKEEVAMRKLMLKCKAPEFVYNYLFRGIEYNVRDLEDWIRHLSHEIDTNNLMVEETIEEEVPELKLIKQGFILLHEPRDVTATEDRGTPKE